MITNEMIEALRKDVLEKHQVAMVVASRQIQKVMRAEILAEMGQFGHASLALEESRELAFEVELCRVAAMDAIHRLERAEASRIHEDARRIQDANLPYVVAEI